MEALDGNSEWMCLDFSNPVQTDLYRNQNLLTCVRWVPFGDLIDPQLQEFKQWWKLMSLTRERNPEVGLCDEYGGFLAHTGVSLYQATPFS